MVFVLSAVAPHKMQQVGVWVGGGWDVEGGGGECCRSSIGERGVPVWTTAAWCLCCLLLHHTKCDRWGGGWWWVDVLVSSWVGLVAAAAAAAACIYGIAKSGLVCLLSSAHHLRCPAVCSWKPLAGPAQRGCCVEPGSGRVLFRDYADGVLASLV
jgi:hypothetical protein